MPKNLFPRWVKADMVLGNAHSGCRGAGICKISVQRQRSALSLCGCEHVPVLLTRINKHCVRVVIDRQDLSFAHRMKHFYENKAVIHKLILLPHQLREVLRFQDKVGVNAQVIEIHEDKWTYHFFMGLSKIID